MLHYFYWCNFLYLLQEKTFITREKKLLRGEIIYYDVKIFHTRNIYYAENTFIARRKHLLRKVNIYYKEKTCVKGENI